LTADAKLFAEAVALGREVVWLHTSGERFADQAAGRPKAPPRLPDESAPRIPAEGEIPGAPEPLPDAMEHDPATQRLKIGKGYVESVTPEMWAYEVSGKHVLWHWFSYRRRDRTKPPMGDKRPPSPLEQIVPDGWLPEYTTDLLDLLHVLGRLIALEPQQADLLDRIGASRLLSAEELRTAGALAMPETAPASGSKKKGQAPRKPRVIRGKPRRTARAARKVRP
jgi:type ISP restriction-modification system protein